MLKSPNPMFGKREASVPHSALVNTSQAQPQVTQTTATPRPAPAPQKDTSIDHGAGNRLIVGPDVRLKGAEILDCDTLVVEGHVEATMDSRIIRIAENGEFTGKVGIDIAEIHGTFTGELNVREQLIIHATGKVSGTVRYGKVLIEEGGQLCGDVQMLNKSDSKPTVLPPPRVLQS
ncbi:MAG TPA: polymer-forming cytoskeletal protein [Rhodocyclaceae bacterium]|nr:polymer-forming cytoskeletal protein [Rhodocyclaceae bacterium]